MPEFPVLRDIAERPAPVDYLPWIFAALGFVLLGAVLALVFGPGYLRSRRRPAWPDVSDATQSALAELRRLSTDSVDGHGDVASRVGQIMRTYLHRKYGALGLFRTADELLGRNEPESPPINPNLAPFADILRQTEKSRYGGGSDIDENQNDCNGDCGAGDRFHRIQKRCSEREMIAALSDYQLAAPWWLLLLVLVPLLALLRGAPGREQSVSYSSVQLLKTVSRSARALPGYLMPSLMYLCLACSAVALARPQHISTHEQVKASGIEIIIAIDVSLSMGIKDFFIGGKLVDRIAAAKRVTRQFIDGRRNDRIGLVAFAGRPYVPCPLTLDHDWLKQSMDRIKLGIIEQGTAIGSAIGTATARLDQRESRSKIIILITDGASNSGNLTPQDAARIARTLGVKVYPIAVGTPGMHRIPLPNSRRTLPARQEFDVETMEEVASISEGKSYLAEDTDTLEEIFRTH